MDPSQTENFLTIQAAQIGAAALKRSETGAVSDAVTKDYVDDNFLNLEGGEIQGRLVIKKGIQVSGKASFIARVGQETGGFVLEGRTVDGEIAKLLQVYHNGGTVPDAVNYNGKVTSPRNIVNKEYVDGHVSRVVEVLEARIKSLEARLSDE